MATQTNPNSLRNLKPLKKGETANPNGRPKKGISLVNGQLASEGYLPATKADIETNYMALMQISEERMRELMNDKEQPMLIRILARNMLSGKGFDVIEKMLDRGIGRAVQRTENDTVLSGEIGVVSLKGYTDEQIEEYMKMKLAKQ